VASPLATRFVCSGCGYEIPAREPFPFSCPHRGDGRDHVLVRHLKLERVAGGGKDSLLESLSHSEMNPYLRYRRAFHAYRVALASGMSDEDYVALVKDLDARVAEADGMTRIGKAGTGFLETPFAVQEALASAARYEGGALWVKDETHNVSGSHKARHLMGIAIWLSVAEKLGLLPFSKRPPLAIASCGNAALAAAVVARALQWRLLVFVPTEADESVLAHMRALQAEIQVCPREKGMKGDPCVQSFHEAVDEGAIPFGCQGPDNGMTVEGGLSLGYEITGALASRQESLQHIMVQVGGGALASSIFQALFEIAARKTAAEGSHSQQESPQLPRMHTVQTDGGYPLRRAWENLVERMAERLSETPVDDEEAAELLSATHHKEHLDEELEYAAAHRREFMWPWESTPRSIASGILDDETYDWWALLKAMAKSGGIPVVTDELTLRRANKIAREATSIDVSVTGSSGLAGLLSLLRDSTTPITGNTAILFTGIKR